MFEIENLWPTTSAPRYPYSDKFLEYLFILDKEELEWKNKQPKYSFRDQIDHYKPEAIKPARRGLKAQLKALKEQLRGLNLKQEEYYEERILKLPWQQRNDFQIESDKDFDEARSKISSKIKSVMFNLSYLNELEGKTKPIVTGGVTEEEVARAKEVSIMNFVQVNKSGFAKCPFHSEKTASFKVYKDQNTWWCYSENVGGTIIDFIIKQRNMDFLTAVKFLLK